MLELGSLVLISHQNQKDFITLLIMHAYRALLLKWPSCQGLSLKKYDIKLLELKNHNQFEIQNRKAYYTTMTAKNFTFYNYYLNYYSDPLFITSKVNIKLQLCVTSTYGSYAEKHYTAIGLEK